MIDPKLDEYFRGLETRQRGVKYFPEDGEVAILHGGSTRAVDEKTFRVEAVINTRTVDSHLTIIEPSGCDTSEFRKNPQVLWSHDQYLQPIANSVEERVTPENIVGVAEFFPGLTQLSRELWSLVQMDKVRGWSIRFKPDQWLFVNPDEHGGADAIIQKWRLREYSLVNFPSNPDTWTLRAARSVLDAARSQHRNIPTSVLSGDLAVVSRACMLMSKAEEPKRERLKTEALERLLDDLEVESALARSEKAEPLTDAELKDIITKAEERLAVLSLLS